MKKFLVSCDVSVIFCNNKGQGNFLGNHNLDTIQKHKKKHNLETQFLEHFTAIFGILNKKYLYRKKRFWEVSERIRAFCANRDGYSYIHVAFREQYSVKQSLEENTKNYIRNSAHISCANYIRNSAHISCEAEQQVS